MFVVCVFKLNSSTVWISHIGKCPDFASGYDEEFLVRISVKTLIRKEQTAKATFLQIRRGCVSRKTSAKLFVSLLIMSVETKDAKRC